MRTLRHRLTQALGGQTPHTRPKYLLHSQMILVYKGWQKSRTKINDNKPTSLVFTAIQTPSVTSVNDSYELHRIKESLADLTLQLKNLQNTIRQRGIIPNEQARRSPRLDRRRSSSARRNRLKFDTCWYHYKFGQ